MPAANGKAWSRRALGWGAAFFVAGQLTLVAVVEWRFPEWRDPEQGYKLARLRAFLAEAPGRPSVVVLGSSRAGQGIRPDVLPAEAPRVFNYAFNGAGPVRTLVSLHQLLRGGVRPAAVVIEVHPALLHYFEQSVEDVWIWPERRAWGDLAVLARFADRPARPYRRWLRAHLTAASHHRFPLLSCLAPKWLGPDVCEARWRRVDRHGWLGCPKDEVTAEQYRIGLETAARQYGACFHQFQISERVDRALRELLDLCRREGIAVVLLTMPEGSEFRGWYPPAARVAIDAYLTQLGRDHGVPWIDARTWVADDGFYDGHHLLPGGAAAFTRRFGRELAAAGWPPSATLAEGGRP
jgi:hypothetical protein